MSATLLRKLLHLPLQPHRTCRRRRHRRRRWPRDRRGRRHRRRRRGGCSTRRGCRAGAVARVFLIGSFLILLCAVASSCGIIRCCFVRTSIRAFVDDLLLISRRSCQERSAAGEYGDVAGHTSVSSDGGEQEAGSMRAAVHASTNACFALTCWCRCRGIARGGCGHIGLLQLPQPRLLQSHLRAQARKCVGERHSSSADQHLAACCCSELDALPSCCDQLACASSCTHWSASCRLLLTSHGRTRAACTLTAHRTRHARNRLLTCIGITSALRRSD